MFKWAILSGYIMLTQTNNMNCSSSIENRTHTNKQTHRIGDESFSHGQSRMRDENRQSLCVCVLRFSVFV